MPPTDLAEHARQLRTLADDFTALRTRIQDTSCTPGTTAPAQISPLLLTAQELTATALARLTALDSTAYASVPDSSTGLTLLAAVTIGSTQAANHLARALAANPYDGAPFLDHAFIRDARRAQAAPAMTRHLADAAHQIGLSATGCRSVAATVTRALDTTHEATPPAQTTAVPRLTRAQYAALKALALGEGRLYETPSRGMGATRVEAKDGTRISIATFRTLAKHKLVEQDTSTPLLFHGQLITVTERGRQALTGPHPAAAAPSRTVPEPPSARPARRAPGPS